MTAVVESKIAVEGVTSEPTVGAEVQVQSNGAQHVGLYLGRCGEVTLLWSPTSGGVIEVVGASHLVVKAAETSDPTQLLILRALAVEAVARHRQMRDHRAWIDQLVCAAHEAADDRDWCSDFDDLMDGLGLPRRTRDYDVRVRFTASVLVNVTATSIDDATEQITTDDVRQALQAQGWGMEDLEIEDTDLE